LDEKEPRRRLDEELEVGSKNVELFTHFGILVAAPRMRPEQIDR